MDFFCLQMVNFVDFFCLNLVDFFCLQRVNLVNILKDIAMLTEMLDSGKFNEFENSKKFTNSNFVEIFSKLIRYCTKVSKGVTKSESPTLYI